MNTSYKATLVRAVVILLVLVGVIGLLEGVPQLQASADDLVGDVAALSQSLEQPAALEPRNYYVSNPLGNDSWPGTQAQPFKTISRAVGAVEADLAANAASNLTVYIAGGTYREFINMNVPSSAFRLPVSKLDTRPNFRIELLGNPDNLATFLAIWQWYTGEIRAEPPATTV